MKELINFYVKYIKYLGINFVENIFLFKNCVLFIDGLFGFGLEWEIFGDLVEVIS